MDVLPTVRAPGAQTLGFEPAPNRSRRGRRPLLPGHNCAGDVSPAPARQRHPALTGQATGGRRHLRTDFRGKNASALHCAGHRSTDGWPPNVLAICAPCDHWSRRPEQCAGYPNQDAHAPFIQWMLAPPAPGRSYALGLNGAGLLPLYCSSRLDSLVQVLSWLCPPKPSLSRSPPFVNLGIDL